MSSTYTLSEFIARLRTVPGRVRGSSWTTPVRSNPSATMSKSFHPRDWGTILGFRTFLAGRAPR